MFNIALRGISEVVNSVGKVLDNLITTSEERDKIKLALREANNRINEEVLKLEAKYIEQQNKLIEKDRALMAIDAKSDDKLQRRTRPIISLGLFVIIAIKYFVDIFYSLGLLDRQITFDDKFWLIVFGMWGIHAGTRGVEKAIKSYKNGSGEWKN